MTPNTPTIPTTTAERLTALGFMPQERGDIWSRWFHDGSGITLHKWADDSISVSITDPNWAEIPAIMAALAQIALDATGGAR